MTPAVRCAIHCMGLIGCLVMTNGCGDKTMSPENFVITVQYPTQDRGFTCDLRIDQAGLAEWTVRSNSLKPDTQTVGLYRADIGPGRAVDLRTTLDLLDKRGLPAPKPLPPGQDIPVVRLEQNSQVRSRHIDPQSTSPAICQTAEQFRTIIQEAVKNPIRTVTLESVVSANTVTRGQPLLLTISLVAQGKENISTAHPATRNTALGGTIVWGVRSDIPVEDRWPQHSQQLTLAPNHLVEQSMAQPSDGNILILAPGQAARFKFSIPLDWEPGQYDLRIIYLSLGSQAEVLNGRITSLPVTFTIRRP